MLNNTKHTCGGPKFGRLTSGCPRCDELKLGVPARSWGLSVRQRDQLRCREIQAHDCRKSGCGPVCTFGEW